MHLGALPKAEAAFRKALSLHVVSPDAHTGLGVCLQLEGKTRDAVAEHEQALQLDPACVSARVNLAALYTETGNLAKAEALLLSPGAELPEHGLLYARLAVINLYRQQLLAAQTYARRAVELLPRSAISHFVLGQVYQEQHRLTQADQEYRLATTLDPQYAPARYALGVMRGILDTGGDFSHPLGMVDAVNQASPYQELTIQNRQAPGMADRIQAAVLDPTVVRVASRAFGDLQVDGDIGGEKTRDADLSYLHESDDRCGVIGVAASTSSTDGVRANAGTKNDLLGLSIGRKAADNSSGWFALGQVTRENLGDDVAAVSQTPTLRTTNESPYYLLGGNLQQGDHQHTYALVSLSAPWKMSWILVQQTCDQRPFRRAAGGGAPRYPVARQPAAAWAPGWGSGV